ncbi:MAG: MFS transporter [Coprothermobacterota bacterium]|nr:MFS transporter [Coprothermobacterota bacterium]
MPAFLVIWFGQLVSLVGSSMTGFAISIYVWQLTGSATSFSLMAFFFLLPNLVFTPFAGALVDRWNRKLTMMISDIAGLVVNLAMLALLTWGQLEMWHLYALNVFNGIFLAFQWPAYSASISMMLEKKHFARASALMSVAQSSSTILAPVFAAVLIVLIKISGIILLDAVSFLIAIVTLLLVIIPQPPKTKLAQKARSNLLREAAFGFIYIAKYPSLLGLQLTFFFGNLLAAFGNILSTPMILAHTSNNVTALATVETVAGLGRTQAPDQRRDRWLAPYLLWIADARPSAGSHFVGDCHVPAELHHPPGQQLQPGNLASQDPAGNPGQGFLRPPADCSDCCADFDACCRPVGGQSIRASDAPRRGAFLCAGWGVWYRSGQRDVLHDGRGSRLGDPDSHHLLRDPSHPQGRNDRTRFRIAPRNGSRCQRAGHPGSERETGDR